MPSRTPIQSELQRAVRVLPHIARMEIVPRVDTAQAGDGAFFRARVIDDLGRELSGLTVEWRVVTKTYSELGEQASPRTVHFDSIGTRTITSRVGRRTDSLFVVVIDRRKR